MPGAFRVWSHHRHTFALPSGHRFPLRKYARLRRRLIDEGVVTAAEVMEPDPIAWEDLALAHDRRWLERVRDGNLTRREERVLGLPWSHGLVNRARHATQATVLASIDALERGVGMNLGGGTHHAGHASGRGYCLVNDVAVAVALGRRDRGLGPVVVIDCDVHQGDGTAELFAADETVFTVSVHCERNYPFRRIPSDLDLELPAGTGDDRYLEALGEGLDRTLEATSPQLAFYLAGADPWEGDRLGRLALSKAGLRGRDELVIGALREAGARVCVLLAGGYAPDVDDTVDINAATATVAAAAFAGH